MKNITLFCYVLFLIWFILFLKSIFIGSKLGKAKGIILYLVFFLTFGALTGYSYKLDMEMEDLKLSGRKSSMEITCKRTLPPANIPKFLDKHNAGTVLGFKGKVRTAKDI